jgi:hypothetical protein
MNPSPPRHDDDGNFSDLVRSALSPVFAVSAAVVVLRSMGQTWWCDCGQPVPWSLVVHSSHNSQHFIDPYTFTHVLHGLIFFALLKRVMPTAANSTRFLIAVLIESGWEILENSPWIIERYRATTISLNYYGDSIANSIFDIVACASGYWLAGRLGWRLSLLFFVIVELALLIAIRDCLTLNVIMLLHPSEAIKQWQMGV